MYTFMLEMKGYFIMSGVFVKKPDNFGSNTHSDTKNFKGKIQLKPGVFLL